MQDCRQHEPENLRRVLARLPEARQQGKSWLARCPAHDDKNPSLSIAAGDDGRVLLHCFAGCPVDAIAAALQLTLADLAPMQAPPPAPISNGKRRIVATYDYRDAAGGLLFQVVRFEPKDFRQRRPDPNEAGGWLPNLQGVARVLYRLPELLAADPARLVFLVEGEKDADKLAALGLTATTAPGGAGKWRDAYAELLRRRPVVILPDNDKPGREHARNVARSLVTAAALVKILDLPNLPDKGDVSNWLDAGGTAERLQELADAAPVWTPGTDPAPDDRPASVRLCDVAPQALQWLWRGRIPLGKLSFIVGDPGLGKSFLVADLAARVSAGLAWPDAPAHRTPGDVWLVSLEDDLADTIRPRLDAAGADVSRIHALPDLFSLDADLTRLDVAVSHTPEARLLVIDPIAACLGKVDSHKNAEVRGALAPLAALAARRRLAVVCIHHLNKSTAGPALYRPAGSLAFSAAARAVWLVAADRQDKRRRLLLPIKSNLAETLTGLAYCIEDDAARAVGRIVWDPRPIEIGADDALAVWTTEETERRQERKEAAEFLQATLAGGAVATTDLQRLTKEAGHAWATVRRALRELKAMTFRKGGKGGRWYWRLRAGDNDRPLLTDLDDPDAADDTAAELVALAAHKKPR